MNKQLDLTGEIGWTEETCQHELVDRYSDGAAECATCGKELGPAGLMLRHLMAVELVEESEITHHHP